MDRRIAFIAIIVAIIAVLFWTYGSHTHDTSKESIVKTSQGKAPSEPSPQEYAVTPIKGTYVTEYPLPPKSGPNSILVDANGTIWSVGSFSHDLYHLDPVAIKLYAYSISDENDISNRMSWSMVQDSRGFIWFDQFGSRPLWRFDPSSGKFLSFPSVTFAPFQMKYNSKTDEIWFTTLSNDKLGVIQKIRNDTRPDDYRIREFSTGTGSYPSGLTFQGDSVWVTELAMGKIAKFYPVRGSMGEVTSINKTLTIPSTNGTLFSSPTDILFSDRNTVWITEHGPSTITEYDIETGNYTRFPTAQNWFHISSLPFWLRNSLDGNGIWSNEHEGGNMAFLDTSKSILTEFKVGTNKTKVIFMLNLALDPTNPKRVWFSEWNNDKIGAVNHETDGPFRIMSNSSNVVFDPTNGKSDAVVDFEILKNNGSDLVNYDRTIFLNVTSSMEPDGSVDNMTWSFSQDSVDLSKTDSPIHLRVDLHDVNLVPRNYTLGINAGNGLISKTIFERMVVR